MKLKNGCITHRSENGTILVGSGDCHFSGLIRFNDTAAFIVDLLKDETDRETIVKKILAKYDTTPTVAEHDVTDLLNQLKALGLLNE